MITVKIMKINPKDSIEIPTFAYATDACADIQANVNEIIKPGEIKIIPTGVKIQLPIGWEAQVRPRSGLAAKHGISLVNTPGTIDADYRGEVKIIMVNFGKVDFPIKVGDRIAQIAIREVPRVQFVLVDQLDETSRNEGGFGSTGVNNNN